MCMGEHTTDTEILKHNLLRYHKEYLLHNNAVIVWKYNTELNSVMAHPKITTSLTANIVKYLYWLTVHIHIILVKQRWTLICEFARTQLGNTPKQETHSFDFNETSASVQEVDPFCQNWVRCKIFSDTFGVPKSITKETLIE